ncbi:MAG TPA: TRAP transporter substrate-binding protein [Bacillota bacterium]|nr:TRAP transporter substrate-binding protein [Bacillota bacterium]
MKNKFLTFLLLILVSVVIVACGDSDSDENDSADNGDDGATESVTWEANAVYPEDNHTTKALMDLAAKVEEDTDGAVNMNVMAGGALGYEGPELLTAVKDNSVTVSDMLTSGVAGDEPLFEIVTLPFLIQDFEEAKVLNDIARPYFDEVAEEKWNQKILYIAPWPFAGFWTQDTVESVDDMQGLKMRTYDKNGALVVEAGKGTPHPLPFSEVYSSLSTGVIDSVLTSSPTAVDAKFWEVLDYYAPVNATMATSFVSVNLDEFNKLDEETQQLIMDAAAEIEAEVWEDAVVLDEDQVGISVDNGIEVLDVSDEFKQELSDLTEDIRADWLETAPEEANEIIEKFNEEVGR